MAATQPTERQNDIQFRQLLKPSIPQKGGAE
jgi:hypothetical protein